MQNLDIYGKRIRQFIERVLALRYTTTAPLEVVYTHDKAKPIPYGKLEKRTWKAIVPGTHWGRLWASAWFRFSGTVPVEFAGGEVVALVDLGGEGCLIVDGTPALGLTDLPRIPGRPTGKRRIPLFEKACGGEKVDLLVEAGANALNGYRGHDEFSLRQAELAVLDRPMWQLGIDLDFLYELAEALPRESVRARRIYTGLNDAANAWADGAGAEAVRAVCKRLLKQKANASATTAWSVGHAHIDLGWLWPVRETRRKAGRTFATALRLLEEYPDYVFGASQPQMYAWVKEDYPRLYERVKAAVKGGRWETQGAMWVEPDMNVTGGESLVRQLLYGKRFFREEFGEEVTNLWLPDVFGYSAALPQILKLAGVDFFMTQKISWNEMNRFPHHTFEWEGIDGTRIRTHFLPMDTYNGANTPEQLIRGERNFAQADVTDDWLNLYGVGDGGGGPGRRHIELALRAANTEGLPKVKLAKASEFFTRVLKTPADSLPVWKGELYLELHRGTFTTQARMKQLNRRLENALRDLEFLEVIAGMNLRAELEPVWKMTLLNQFHDILPGSSIDKVYEQAYAESEQNLQEISRLTAAALKALHGAAPGNPRSFVLYNTLSWERHALAFVPWSGAGTPVLRDIEGRALVAQPVDGGLLVPVTVPPMGCTGVVASGPADAPDSSRQAFEDAPRASSTPEAGRWSRERIVPVKGTEKTLENALVRVELAPDGTIGSIYDKEFAREVLSDGANRLLLWEDLPYSWDAWDISHYYRETTPSQAELVERRLVEGGPLRAAVEQRLRVGSSQIVQRIELEAESKLVRIVNRVEWHESHKQLRVQAIAAIHAPSASYEIQFGTVRRPAHANTSWEAAQFEVPGQRFADLSQPDYGLGIVNDSKYGHLIRDGVMELTLLRSSKDPDPNADIGTHEFVYGYYPHALGWEASELLERAHELNAPLLTRAVSVLPAEPISEFSITGGIVKLETVKRAEDSDAVIIRLYETRGTDHSIVLETRRPIASMVEVDLLEEVTQKVGGVRKASSPRYASAVPLRFSPFQIRSFRVEFGQP